MCEIIISTERLILRPFQESDVDDLFEYSKNPNVGNNAGWAPHKNLENSREVLKEVFLGQNTVFAIVLDGKVIGSAGLVPDPKRQNPKAMMLGYAMGEKYWGNGYMTEAVQSIISFGLASEPIGLGLDIISAYIYPFNSRSRRVLQKCGFSYEGILHQAELHHSGSIYDEECFFLKRKGK